MRTAAALLLLIASPRLPGAQPAVTNLDSLGITVTGTSRPFVYTNGQTALLYGETGAANSTGWQGFNVFGHEVLDDYLLIVDGEVLRREDALTATVYPDHLVREYPGGIVEQVRPPDSLAAVGLIVTSSRPITLRFVPLFADAGADDLVIEREAETLLIGRRRAPAGARSFPAWLAVTGRACTADEADIRDAGRSGPATLSSGPGKTHILAFAAGETRQGAKAEAEGFAGDPAGRFRVRRARMERLLTETAVRTGDPRFDRALAWAKLSLDALMMNQIARGIFAGLPWFNNYWGRDTFISLPGACLVTGRFAEAKAILRSFASFQQRDPASPDEGRIPNIVTTTEKAYNTADGTPRFVITAREYVLRSGDTAFAREIYPVVRRSIEGTRRHHTDSLGFLTHGHAETWMDAVGPDGPWSPRGDRANDIQALWAGQLAAGAWFAGRAGDTASVAAWNALHTKVEENFRKHFLDREGIADRLLPDGTRDRSLRPNQLFTAGLLPPNERKQMLRTVTTKLAYEHGVASLWQEEENFHPYHIHDTFYPKDAAYHNGIVWTWLQGPLISDLCRTGNQETAYRITANSVHQILDRGAVGTQSELLDALPRPGETEPRLSGTVSQAWNLAEFVRNFYDDYLGARITRIDHTLVLRPHLPVALGGVSAVLNMDGRGVGVSVGPGAATVELDGRNLRVGGRAVVYFPGEAGRELEVIATLPPGAILKLNFNGNNVTLGKSIGKVSPSIVSQKWSAFDTLHGLELARPALRAGLKSLTGPPYPLLPHAVVKGRDASAKTVCDLPDPAGDDTGVEADGGPAGAFTYPTNPNFVPGCLDLVRFRVDEGDSLTFFQLSFAGLSNPGWHPEYGFQLTFVAIAQDLDGVPGSGTALVPRNSGFRLPPDRAYERLILVGGGIRVEDAGGEVLAAYIPAGGDVADPLGDVAQRRITFALPRSLVRGEGRWTVLVGAQDDHGGSGLGEFRTVQAEGAEWAGGGRRSPRDANVYDALFTGP